MIEINKHTDLELAFMAIDGLIGNGDDSLPADQAGVKPQIPCDPASLSPPI